MNSDLIVLGGSPLWSIMRHLHRLWKPIEEKDGKATDKISGNIKLLLKSWLESIPEKRCVVAINQTIFNSFGLIT